jgi:pimeloyl-ACP methyl ester carboxylesterase
MTSSAWFLWRRPTWRHVAIGYLTLVGAGAVVRAVRPAPPAVSDGTTAELRAVDGGRRLERPVIVAYRDHAGPTPAATAAVLLHGSPGHVQDFRMLVPRLVGAHRVVVPDLPGFGGSQRDVPDYSIQAHADYTVQLMDRLGLPAVHLVGFSMGSGVALSLAGLAPRRVASMTLLSGLGVQEMELLGSYHANHVVHGAQLALLVAARYLVPSLSRRPSNGLTVEYARNFYDSDQRPLRRVLAELTVPTLIVHGTRDWLVPHAAALEHHRLVPQSELVTLDDTHFLLFGDRPVVAETVAGFLDRVDRGAATGRGQASAARLAEAAAPFDARRLPSAVGVTAMVLALCIVLGGAISVDAAAVTAGLLVAQGRASAGLMLVAGVAGVIVAVLVRARARPSRAAGGWMATAIGEAFRGAAAHPGASGGPGGRGGGLVPGLAARVAFALLSAVALGVPAFWLGRLALTHGALPLGLLPSAVIGVAASLLCGAGVNFATLRGRRRLVGAWRRLTTWEFWPVWAVYPPVVLYVLALMVRHRSATVFTAANPGIPLGGFIGESKIDILRALEPSDRVARSHLLSAAAPPDERVRDALDFMSRHRLALPVVLKPDRGQRGSGVVVVRTARDLEDFLRRAAVDTIVQEYVPGVEYGVFYYRHPAEARGHILSITEKRFPEVVADGRHTIEELIVLDARAVSMADLYQARLAERLHEVPAAGVRVALAEIGSHCRGAIFLDGRALLTDALVESVDRVARTFDGFWFGRFDVRAGSPEAFARGHDFTVIELNGVTSEATHIYDPGHGVWTAWRVLCHQWRLAFEIGAENRRRGARAASILEIIQAVGAYRRQARHHFGEVVDAAGVPAGLGWRLSAGAAQREKAG